MAAEKHEELPSISNSKTALHTVIDTPKNLTHVDDPLSRHLVSGLPPVQPSNEEHHQPPLVKEGFNYWNRLPYDVEDDDTRITYLNQIINDLYVYIRVGDFEGGARTASRQIKRWLHLKFKMPKDTRIKLCKLYYQLSLTPGIDPSAADTFANMFRLLAS
jgi:proteasome activator subunit 4